ncbi:uncharacterized protein LOC116348599 isoform X1 [Contarinia nasturtii]|uniref:uncharacterized protein LOC116348599 isoform X1 n=1 Tax=Contarinia nasturtii TaxID=265458 RepID=UPI0012D4BD40|nr:uncharacterized protein LOC116348599 isoform X1 [Contarinia nasturtii]
MQRQIEVFHQYAQQWYAFNRNELTTNNRPPNVNNFTLVPLCRFQLKNIRLDMKDMYYLANNVLGVVPSSLNPLTNRMNLYSLEYYRNGHKEELWNLVFDMDKIKQIGKQKQLHFQIVTNSVCVSILYEKPAKAWVENSEQATFNNITITRERAATSSQTSRKTLKYRIHGSTGRLNRKSEIERLIG